MCHNGTYSNCESIRDRNYWKTAIFWPFFIALLVTMAILLTYAYYRRKSRKIFRANEEASSGRRQRENYQRHSLRFQVDYSLSRRPTVNITISNSNINLRTVDLPSRQNSDLNSEKAIPNCRTPPPPRYSETTRIGSYVRWKIFLKLFSTWRWYRILDFLKKFCTFSTDPVSWNFSAIFAWQFVALYPALEPGGTVSYWTIWPFHYALIRFSSWQIPTILILSSRDFHTDRRHFRVSSFFWTPRRNFSTLVFPMSFVNSLFQTTHA